MFVKPVKLDEPAKLADPAIVARMLTTKIYHKKPGHSSHSQPVPRMEEARGTGGRHTAPLKAIFIVANDWDSMKQTALQALKKLVNLISKAGADPDERRLGVSLYVR